MSIDRWLRHEDAARKQRAVPDRSSRMDHRPPHMIELPDAAQIARQLIDKYGVDALAFARDRAARAVEVGDDLALDCWQVVIETAESLLGQMAEA